MTQVQVISEKNSVVLQNEWLCVHCHTEKGRTFFTLEYNGYQYLKSFADAIYVDGGIPFAGADVSYSHQRFADKTGEGTMFVAEFKRQKLDDRFIGRCMFHIYDEYPLIVIAQALRIETPFPRWITNEPISVDASVGGSIGPDGGRCFITGKNVRWFPSMVADDMGTYQGVSKLDEYSWYDTPAVFYYPECETGMVIAPLTANLFLYGFQGGHEGNFRVAPACGDVHRAKPENRTIELEFDKLCIIFDSDPAVALDTYARLAYRHNQPQSERTAPDILTTGRGYCTWRAYGPKIDEKMVLKDVDFIVSELQSENYQWIIIDDGWEKTARKNLWTTAVDWRLYDEEKFPSGIAHTVAECKNKGLTVLLWMAPHQLAKSSPLIAQHPDWIKADVGESYLLDIFNPGVVAYLEDIFATYASWGVSGVKVDFISDMWDCWQEGETGCKAVHRYLEVLNECATRHNMMVFLCNAPYTPALSRFPNLVAARVSNDVGNDAMHNARLVSAALKMQWVGHLIAVDPDYTVTHLPLTKNLVTLNLLMNSVFYFSNSAEEADVNVLKSLPRLKGMARPLPQAWTTDLVETAYNYDGERLYVGVWNWDEKVQIRNLEFVRFGLDAKVEYEVTEFWSKENLGRHRGHLEFQLDGGSCKLFIISK